MKYSVKLERLYGRNMLISERSMYDLSGSTGRV